MSAGDPFEAERDMFKRAFGAGPSARVPNSVLSRHERAAKKRLTRPADVKPSTVVPRSLSSLAAPAETPMQPSIPTSTRATAPERSEILAAPAQDDRELLTMMTSRLRTLETSRRQLRDALVTKEKECIRLHARLDVAERSVATSSHKEIVEEIEAVRDENERLRAQVFEMETFLSDYGLVWVGNQGDDDGSTGNSGQAYSDGQADAGRYAGFTPKRDALVLWQRVEALNRRAGEGSKRVVVDKGGVARLAEAPRVPLSLFSDGFMLWRGPFRSVVPAKAATVAVGDPPVLTGPSASELRSNQSFLADLLDGFFPSEFRQDHPDGVVLDLHDHSGREYKEWLLAGRPKGCTMEQAASASAGERTEGVGGSNAGNKKRGAFVGQGAKAGGRGADASHAGAANVSNLRPRLRMPSTGPKVQREEGEGEGGSQSHSEPLGSDGPHAPVGGVLKALASLGGCDEMPLPLPRDRFLGRLSDKAVRRGRVVSIRGGISEAMATKKGGRNHRIAGDEGKGARVDALHCDASEIDTGVILADTRALRSLRADGAFDGGRDEDEDDEDEDKMGMTFRPQSVTRREDVEVSEASSTAAGLGPGRAARGIARGGDLGEHESNQVREQGQGQPQSEPLCPPDVATLQVKSDSGRQKILVKLFFSDTIGDLRRAIDQYRAKVGSYEIRTAYPNRAYEDESETLEEAGLVPNAAVRLVRKH